MTSTQTIDLLDRIPFVRAIGKASLARLLNGGIVQVLPQGAVLFEEGAMPEAAHVVLLGRVGLVASGGTGQETVIEIFGGGTFLLVPAVVLGLPYLASGVVMAESRIMTVRADVFRNELDAEPRFARAVVDMLAEHWRLLIEQIKDLKLRSAVERLADWLLRQADERGDGLVPLSEPKNVLAKRLGMSAESLSRAFAGLAEAGAVTVSGRTVTLRDRQRLMEVACHTRRDDAPARLA